MSAPEVAITVDETVGADDQLIVLSLQVVLFTRRTWKPVVCELFARTRRSARVTLPLTPLT